MTWQIDSAHSQISFSARHMMISKVRGRFENFSGVIDFDESNPAASTVNVEIEAASINTRVEDRDNHLRSADFLDAANHPKLTFAGKRVQVTGDNSGRLIGDLTIRGVAKEVVLDVEYAGQAKSPWGTTSAGFSASTTINRKDWGLEWNAALETGGVLVGDAINIDIELELVKQAETEAAGD
ncbi:MAG: YceI family protein [Ardenticatenaceae bacterium]|nr:YceI family protein [Ardenticatenaceae bacterium]